jgi:hypothetical protein
MFSPVPKLNLNAMMHFFCSVLLALSLARGYCNNQEEYLNQRLMQSWGMLLGIQHGICRVSGLLMQALFFILETVGTRY